MIRDDLINTLFYVFAYITGQNLELFDTNKDFDILYITFEIFFVFLLFDTEQQILKISKVVFYLHGTL